MRNSPALNRSRVAGKVPAKSGLGHDRFPGTATSVSLATVSFSVHRERRYDVQYKTH